MSSETSRAFEQLLDYLKNNRGFDFTGYKRSTLVRRVRKRMSEVGIADFEAYLDYLEVHPLEFSSLFNTILINVTGFFRDDDVWQALAQHAHALLEAGPPGRTLRVWNAGCASGEETYTLVMCLAEVLGLDQFRERVKIYATDADEDALNHARQAVYTDKDVEPVPPELRERYFERTNGKYMFRNDLRRSVIFGRHDLVQDAPISRLELIVCRNTLIYFNSETQGRIIARFHFALNDDGIIFVGRSEMLLTHARLFTPIDTHARLFAKVPRANLRDRMRVLAEGGNGDAGMLLSHNVQLRESAFDTSPFPTLIVDRNAALVAANEQARAMFRISVRDLNRPFQDLEVSYRPVELRSKIDECYAERRAIMLTDVEFPTLRGESRYFDYSVVPLLDGGGLTAGVSITFTDVTRSHRLQHELERSAHELETAYEELQATNEELETTNEELQSTIEELETTNEELQSTNEELETMNEELQSTNEELETINEELRGRTDELNHLITYTQAVMASLRSGVVVLDKNTHVRTWNRKAEDLWGVREEETRGRHFLSADIGLPVEQLKAPIKAVIEGGSEYEEKILLAVNRRGRSIMCRVTVTAMNVDGEQRPEGAILVMEEWNGTQP